MYGWTYYTGDILDTYTGWLLVYIVSPEEQQLFLYFTSDPIDPFDRMYGEYSVQKK